MLAVLFVLLASEAALARPCNFNNSDLHRDGVCAEWKGLSPVAVLDPKYDKMLCYWPDFNHSSDPDDWASIQVGKAHPVNVNDWSTVNQDDSMPADIRSRLSKAPFLVCSGTELCCFDGGYGDVQNPEPALGRTVDTLKLGWKDCGDSSTHSKVTGLTPPSMATDSLTSILGTGTLDEAISGGTVSVTVTVKFFRISFTGDLCAPKSFSLPLFMMNITWNGMDCPVAAGATSVSTSISVASTLPGNVDRPETNLALTATALNGDKLLCMEIDMTPERRRLSNMTDVMV